MDNVKGRERILLEKRRTVPMSTRREEAKVAQCASRRKQIINTG